MSRAGKTILWLVVTATLALAIVVWRLGRERRDTEIQTQRLRDSLETLETRFGILTERERAAVVTLQVSNRLLDSALAKAPQIVYVTRTRTIASPGDSGTTVVDSLPYVAKSDYDTLASRCSRVQQDCATVVAVKDSLLTVRSGESSTLHGLLDLSDRRLITERKRNRLLVLRGFGFGLAAGGLGCALLCR